MAAAQINDDAAQGHVHVYESGVVGENANDAVDDSDMSISNIHLNIMCTSTLPEKI